MPLDALAVDCSGKPYVWSLDELARFNAYMNSNEPLWEPLPPLPPHLAKILDWFREPPVDSLPPQELGAAKDRLRLIVRSILHNVAAYYRKHPLASVIIGVLVVDSIFSDNRDGSSTLSAERLAALLMRDESTVRRARALLVTLNLLGRVKRPGLSDRHYALIDRMLAGENVPLTWWLDATSEPPAARGRPGKTPGTRYPPFTEKTPSTRYPPFTENPGHPVPDEFSLSKEIRPEAAVQQSPTPHLTPAGFVISAQHGLVVPMQTVAAWRARFPDIPDLEAAMGKLAATILARGPMHPGWSCPEGWMAGVLAHMNREAANEAKVTAARLARVAASGIGSRNGRRTDAGWRNGVTTRNEIDAA
jgi:hypothetical protein